MEHAEFVAASQLWLGVDVLPCDDWCPRCDQIMDTRGAHAVECMAGGDAVTTHNCLRDHAYHASLSAGLRVEHEESDLLPDDPLRRPGDLYFPTWARGRKVAMDFAVTSPLQASMVTAAAHTVLAAAAAYEERKRVDRDTAARCNAQGIELIPMVVESFGGWGRAAQEAFRVLARARAARSGQSVSMATSQLYQGLSIKLMRANARALLARVAAGEEATAGGPRERAQGLLEATAV